MSATGFDNDVLQALRGAGSRIPSYYIRNKLADQLGVGRFDISVVRVLRALKRLRAAGLVSSDGGAEWGRGHMYRWSIAKAEGNTP